ncbi:YueI family protein [Desulfoscipio geothermicus]|nr:YueI family protein [Desulfoscipio geothermicus]
MTEQDIQAEAIGTWMNKNELEKALAIGIYGPPELKHDEKVHYLGEFKERVIRLLTRKQVAEPAIYPEIIEALKDKRAARLVINGDIADCFIEKYEELARKLGKPYTVVHDPELKGEAGLAVVSNDAVDVEEFNVPDREIRLSKLGLSKALINAAGKKVCSHCLEKIIRADPGEVINYHKLTMSDRFWGEHCRACASKP